MQTHTAWAVQCTAAKIGNIFPRMLETNFVNCYNICCIFMRRYKLLYADGKEWLFF